MHKNIADICQELQVMFASNIRDFVVGMLVPDGLIWVFQKQLISWDFYAQRSGVQRGVVLWARMS